MRKIILYILLALQNALLRSLRRKFQPHFHEDFDGERVFMVSQLPGDDDTWKGERRKNVDLGNTFSWKRFFRIPLDEKPETLNDIETFLKCCTYLSDQETRGCADYWEPPDVFEQRKTGDCEDHAIWAWRQLHDMGFRSRLVIGACKTGHAWVHIFVNGRVYLLEATQKQSGFPNPKRYKAQWSVERLKNKNFGFYYHSHETDRGA